MGLLIEDWVFLHCDSGIFTYVKGQNASSTAGVRQGVSYQRSVREEHGKERV